MLKLIKCCRSEINRNSASKRLVIIGRNYISTLGLILLHGEFFFVEHVFFFFKFKLPQLLQLVMESVLRWRLTMLHERWRRYVERHQHYKTIWLCNMSALYLHRTTVYKKLPWCNLPRIGYSELSEPYVRKLRRFEDKREVNSASFWSWPVARLRAWRFACSLGHNQSEKFKCSSSASYRGGMASLWIIQQYVLFGRKLL